MKSKKASAMSVALVLALAPGVMAADMGQTQTPATPQNQAEQPAQPQASGQEQANQAVNLERASKLINEPIKDAQGKTIGKIHGLAVDATDGRVAYVVVSLQNVPNTDKSKYYALPFQTLRQAQDQKSFTLTVSEDKLSQAKSFDKSQWPDKATLELGSPNYQVFGFAPYWQANGQGAQGQATGQQGRQQAEQELQAAFEQAGLSPQEAQSRSQDLINRLDAQVISKGQAEQQIQQALQGAGLNQPQAEEHARKVAASLESAKPGSSAVPQHQSGMPQSPSQRQQQQSAQPQNQNQTNNDPPADQSNQTDQNAAQPNAAQSGQNNQAQPGQMGAQSNGQATNGQRWVSSFKSIKGKAVNDAQGKKLGAIEDLVIDPHEGRIVYAVIGHGGVFGMGQKLAAVPYRALQVDQQKQDFTLNATEKKLDQYSFSSTNWPDMNNEQWAQRVHTAFGQQPYWQVYGYAAPGTAGAQQPGQQPGEQATPGQQQPGQQATPGQQPNEQNQSGQNGMQNNQNGAQQQNSQNNQNNGSGTGNGGNGGY